MTSGDRSSDDPALRCRSLRVSCDLVRDPRDDQLATPGRAGTIGDRERQNAVPSHNPARGQAAISVTAANQLPHSQKGRLPPVGSPHPLLLRSPLQTWAAPWGGPFYLRPGPVASKPSPRLLGAEQARSAETRRRTRRTRLKRRAASINDREGRNGLPFDQEQFS
jgi:hypothetical protein